jgi:hypothetical protein
MMAADRPPTLLVWVLIPGRFLFLAAGPVGKWETQLHRVFHFSSRAGSPFFLVLFLYE